MKGISRDGLSWIYWFWFCPAANKKHVTCYVRGERAGGGGGEGEGVFFLVLRSFAGVLAKLKYLNTQQDEKDMVYSQSGCPFPRHFARHGKINLRYSGTILNFEVESYAPSKLPIKTKAFLNNVAKWRGN